MDSDIILVIVVATALAFDFTNGFHDTANAIATSISTRAMGPRTAVAMSATLNFVGAFLSLQVAATIAKGIVDSNVITPPIVFAGLIGAIAWNLATWWFGSAASAVAAGTYVGGWRIIRTMGSRIIKMDPAQGFAAQGAGAAVILSASHAGFPLSTTHVISGGIMGAGAAKRFSAVRWGVAGIIAVAWVLTLPCAAAVGALTFAIVRVIGEKTAGPLVVAIVLALALAAAFVRRFGTVPATS